jgi:alanyl-tRNA synthetase
MPAKKKISTADLKKLFKEAHKLDPMKPVPKNVANRMDATIAKLAAAEKAAQAKSKPLSQMTNAELRASAAVLKNKKALADAKLAAKNKKIVSNIRASRGGRGGGAGGAFLENLK